MPPSIPLSSFLARKLSCYRLKVAGQRLPAVALIGAILFCNPAVALSLGSHPSRHYSQEPQQQPKDKQQDQRSAQRQRDQSQPDSNKPTGEETVKVKSDGLDRTPLQNTTTPPAQAASQGDPIPGEFSQPDRGVKLNRLVPEPDPTTGALIFEYPFTLPPGRNGLQPELRLEYNSQNTATDSILGYGWSINIPFIQRLNKSGSDNLYSDGYFTSSISGELVQTSPTTYAAKVENGDFLKYSFAGNTWTVTDKAGVVYTYGSQTFTRQDDPVNPNNVFKWMLEEVRDPNDNFISYSYTKDQSQIYPDAVTYTGNGTTPGIYKVSFLNETRSDLMTSYHGQFKVTTAKRLRTVLLLVSNTPRRSYSLAYGLGDNGTRSLIGSIVETGTDETGATISKTTSYSYSKNSQTSVPLDDRGVPTVNWTPSVPGVPPVPTQGCLISTSNGANPHGIGDCGMRLADLNGDGLPDYVMAYSAIDNYGTATNYYSDYVEVGINNGDNTFTKVPWKLPPNDEFYNYWTQPGVNLVLYQTNYPSLVFTQNQTSISNPEHSTGLQLIDVNGDGRADLIWQDVGIGTNGSVNPLCNNLQAPWKIFLNNGSGWTYSPASFSQRLHAQSSRTRSCDLQ